MTTTRPRILVLGAYGTFGGRYIDLVADNPGLTIIVAGRTEHAARAFCHARANKAARLIPEVVDRTGDLEPVFTRLQPNIVIDATGPFQIYPDGNTYAVIEAALAAGAHYMDLADDPDFVSGVTQFDERAKERGVFILSGMSTLPALSGAALRELTKGDVTLQTIEGGIAPSPYADIGHNVIEGIASYAGMPFQLLRDGRKQTVAALTEYRRHTIAPPGALPMHNRHFSLVNVPDNALMPELYPGLTSIWMGTGTAPELTHRVLNVFAKSVHLGILPRLTKAAGLFHRVKHTLRWGEHRGGFYIRVTGQDKNSTPIDRSFNLIAEGDNGPYIPSMALTVVTQQILAGKAPDTGARPATNELGIEDFRPLFDAHAITTGIRDHTPPGTSPDSLYLPILNTAWDKLPRTIRGMHVFAETQTANGTATIERGTNPIAKLVATIFRFPPAGDDVPVTVTMTRKNGTETWVRNFGGHRFSSKQSAGIGRNAHLIAERFGPFTFHLAPVVKDERLHLIPRSWTKFGIPMPKSLVPHGDAYEYEQDGLFHFDVDIRLPFIGRLVRYRGSLKQSNAQMSPVDAANELAPAAPVPK